MSKTVTSIYVKAHEVYIKPLKPRQSLLIQESDNKSDDDEQSKNEDIPDLVMSDIEEEVTE